MPRFQWFGNLLNWVSNFFLARIGTLWNRLNIENNIMKYSDIINDYNLWMEYVDQAGLDSEEDFNNMTFAEKLDIIKASFGLEVNA